MARRLPTATDRSVQMSSLADLGELVRNARARAQLRIDDAAAVCGVSADLMSRLERGRPVSSDKLLAVLSSLGLAVLVVDKVQADRLETRLADDARQPR